MTVKYLAQGFSTCGYGPLGGDGGGAREGLTTLLQGWHIRLPAYQPRAFQFLTVAKLQL